MKETVAGCCRYGTIWSCRKFLHNTFSVAYFSGYPPCCGKPNGHSHHPQFVHVTRVGFWGDRHPSKTHHAMWNSVELWVSGAIPKAWCMTNNHMAESPTHYTIYIPYTTFAKLRFTCSWVYLKQPQFSWTLNFLVDNNPVEHVNGRGMFVPNVYKHKENQRNICWSEISQLLMVTLLRSGKKKKTVLHKWNMNIHPPFTHMLFIFFLVDLCLPQGVSLRQVQPVQSDQSETRTLLGGKRRNTSVGLKTCLFIMDSSTVCTNLF